MIRLKKNGKIIFYVIMVTFFILYVKGIESRKMLYGILENKKFTCIKEGWNFQIIDPVNESPRTRKEYKQETKIILKTRLPDLEYENPNMLLVSMYKEVIIRLDEDIIYQSYPGMSDKKVNGRVYLLVNLPETYQGKVLSIEGIGTDILSYPRVPPVIIGGHYEIVYFFLLKELLWLFNGVLLCILGIILVIAANYFDMQYKITEWKATMLPRACIFSGVWMITESRMFAPLFNIFEVVYYINYLCLYFSIIYFMDFMADTGNEQVNMKLKRFKFLLMVIFFIGTIGEAVHGIGYAEILPLLLGVVLLGYGLIMIGLVRNYKQNKNKVKVHIGVLFFIVICIEGIFLHRTVLDIECGIMMMHATSAAVIIYLLIKGFDIYIKSIQEELLNQTLKLHLKVQIQHYKDVLRAQKELSIFCHDNKNRLLTLQVMLKQGKEKEAIDYIAALTGKIEVVKEATIFNSPVLDAILNEKYSETQKKGIKFIMDIRIPEDINLDSDEWISIIGNLLDNAIEACEKIHYGEKKIIAIIKYQKGLLCIKVINSISEKSINFVITSKREHEGHGFGLISIKQITKKYQGNFKVGIKNGQCVAEIIIPVFIR